ncbi:MAG: hypothetical protein ABI605_15360 [Rhizobacter sp.]
MATPPRISALRSPPPVVQPRAAAPLRQQGTGVSPTSMFAQRSGGGNQAALQAVAQSKAAQQPAANEATAARRPVARLPQLSPETREHMLADVEYIVRILKGGTPDSADQIYLLTALRKWRDKDLELTTSERAGRRTPMFDHFLILLKSRSFARSSFRSLWQDQYAIVYDALWYEMRGYPLAEFKRMVEQSETQRTEGAESKNIENGAALIAKQEAMGMWGMLKGMGTGLVSMAGPEAAQYIGSQFDETAHILFGHEWDSSEPLVWGMNAGQIGTAGGDVIMQLAMFARSAGAKGGQVLQLLNNLDKLKRAQQVLGALGGAQGVLMAAKGIADLLDAKRKAGEKITADALLHDTAFVNQLVMLLSSGVGIALAVKGAPPSAQQAATRARIGLLLSTVQVTSAVAELSRIAASDASELEKEVEYGQVVAGLIPQLVGLVIAGHGHVQAKREAAQERTSQAEAQNQDAKTPPVDEPAQKELPPPETQADAPASKAMSASGDNAPPQKKLSANAALEQARKPIADAHQAQMKDEVQNRLAPRDAPAMPADLAAGLREPHFTPPARGEKSKTIGQPHPTLEAARQTYDLVLAETGGLVEAGIWQHPDTGHYVVQLGHPTSVDPPDAHAGWRSVQHFHPNTSDVPLWRMPSSADVSGLVEQVMRQGGTSTEIVEYPLPNGKRGRAAYTVTSEGKLIVEYVGVDGKRVPKTFDKVEDYKAYHPARKVAADPTIRADTDAWVAARRGNKPDDTPGPGGQAMYAAAPKKTAAAKPSAADVARAEEWKNKVPAADAHSFKDVKAELALPEPSSPPKKGTPPPALKVDPPSSERQVAVRVQGDSKNKGHFIVGPELPAKQDVFNVDTAAYLASASDEFNAAAANPAFLVLTETQARAMGFVEMGKPFKSAAEDQAFAARTNALGPVAPEFTPAQKNGVTLESSKAAPDSHPIAARTSPKKGAAKAKEAWDRTIGPSLEESESYKFQLLKKKELGLKRAGNASEKGADHITADLTTDPPRIYLNDATTPDQVKNRKPTHKDWYEQFKKDFPADAKGVRDFGFADPVINAKLNAAVDAGDVYTRTLRPIDIDDGSLGKHQVMDLKTDPLHQYDADPAVKVGRKKPSKN